MSRAYNFTASSTVSRDLGRSFCKRGTPRYYMEQPGGGLQGRVAITPYGQVPPGRARLAGRSVPHTHAHAHAHVHAHHTPQQQQQQPRSSSCAQRRARPYYHRGTTARDLFVARGASSLGGGAPLGVVPALGQPAPPLPPPNTRPSNGPGELLNYPAHTSNYPGVGRGGHIWENASTGVAWARDSARPRFEGVYSDEVRQDRAANPVLATKELSRLCDVTVRDPFGGGNLGGGERAGGRGGRGGGGRTKLSLAPQRQAFAQESLRSTLVQRREVCGGRLRIDRVFDKWRS
jgi:hypothetical protein